MWRNVIRIWFCFLICLSFIYIFSISYDFVGNVSGGTTRYVNTTGSGGAFTSIQDAIDAANPGDTVFVYSGTYYENVVVDKTITLIGENRNNTTINGTGGNDVVRITADWVNVSEFTVKNGSGPTDSGIELYKVNNCNIINNRAINNTKGIFLWDSDANQVIDNNASSNEWYGISLQSSSGNTVTHNEIWNCFDGILLSSGSQNNEILYNDVSSSAQANIDIWGANNNFVANNTVTFSSGPGVQIIASSNNFIFNNSIYDNDGGITLLNSTWNTLADNLVTSNNGRGIYLQEPSNNNTVTNNTISFNQDEGIELYRSSYNRITYNKISNNQYGIHLLPASNNTLANNEVYSNNLYGIVLRPSSNDNTIDNNDIYSNNDIGIYLWETSNRNTITNNYISNHDYYGIRVSTFSNNTQIANNNVFSNDWWGIYITDSSKANIMGNNVSNNLIGIYIVSSSGINITYNSILLNTGSGISLDSSNNNVITGNEISWNNDGIYFSDSTDNCVAQNNVTNNGDGIFLSSSSKNNVTNNNISNNGDGIYISSSSTNNTIYHNNFINNTDQADDYSDNGNQWDNGYPSGGNYWSDYNGVDNYKGPDQNITGSDDIGDTNYSIDSDSFDNYPLIWPFGIDTPVRNLDKRTYYDKIQDAIDDADPGNRIFVKSGIFYENLLIDKTINLTGENRNNTIIDGYRNNYVVNISADWVNMTGFLVMNGSTSYPNAGVEIIESSNCTVYGCNIRYNMVGIRILSSFNNIIIDNNVSSNYKHGIALYYSDGNEVLDNTASLNDVEGIFLSYSNQNSIVENNVFSNRYGIYITTSHDNTISSNIIESNTLPGIYLLDSNRNNITSNDISNCIYGIVLSSTFGNKLISNSIHSISYMAIYLEFSTSVNISNNSIIDNGIFIAGDSLEFWNTHEIDDSNTVNGKSIQYLKNESNETAPLGAGQVIMSNCTNMNIVNQEIKYGHTGILLGYCSNINIFDNNLSYNLEYGLYLHYSNMNNITNNTISFNGIFSTNSGIYLDHSHDNHIIFNTISNNTHGIFLDISYRNDIIQNTLFNNGYGLNLYSSMWSDIIGNNASSNDYGIKLEHSHLNNITGNEFSFNKWGGIYLTKSSNNHIVGNRVISNNVGIYLYDSELNEIIENTVSFNNHRGIELGYDCNQNNIYHNNVINNTENARSDHFNWFNRWESGYPSGGNYWSDNNKSDDFHGPNQNLPGSDNIGDEGYHIITRFSDSYPLMEPYPGTFPPSIELLWPDNNSLIKPGDIIDLQIYDYDVDFAAYTIDTEPEQEFTQPYDISTTGWLDGLHQIFVRANDTMNRSDSKVYYFTIDSIKPEIVLNSPTNNSIIIGPSIVDFAITDENLLNASYSINGGPGIPLTDPFNITTSGWEDGEYIITINALDLAGNENSSWFSFVNDMGNPRIQMITPTNNSIITAGTILDFSINDANLLEANYSVDGGVNISFSFPYNLSTSGWVDGNHTIQINARDSLGNLNSSWFIVTIDSVKPLIILNSPSNNSVISNKTLLSFSVQDLHLLQVNYSINGGMNQTISDPFIISTSSWEDGEFIIEFVALDMAGNSNSSTFHFEIDSTRPEIILNSPLNNSISLNGTLLDFSITDLHLLSVNYSVNEGPYIPFTPPFDMTTSGWDEGEYIIQINAIDMTGNIESSWFFITIDDTKPGITFNSPVNNSIIQSNTIIDFSVIELHLLQVNYSVNGGNDISIYEPYNISTFGWMDGDYLIHIFALDRAGNSNYSMIFFTIDSTRPIISLNNPENNSVIRNGTILDFNIMDSNYLHANYSINGGLDIPFSTPFDITTDGWPDGEYTIQINAIDYASNTNSSGYIIAVYSGSPQIRLISPLNNSFVPSGTILDISVFYPYLIQVNYSINTEKNISFYEPYDISTIGWEEGIYMIQVTVLDIFDNITASWYFITIDSTKPEIQLVSPDNNSYHPEGILLDFDVIEANQLQTNYSINGEPEIPFTDPFDITTSGWPDDDYTIQINAHDEAGNINSVWYFFTIDSTKPSIMLNSPDNNSYIPSGVLLDFTVNDTHLYNVNYSINGGEQMPLLPPYTISTEVWVDGNYAILVIATDLAGNTHSAWFLFTIDSTPPSIVLNSPPNNAIIKAGSILNFSIVDTNLLWVNYSVNDGSFTPFPHPFDINTIGWPDGGYTIKIDVIDKAGNFRSSLFKFTIDSTKPLILLHSPITDGVIKGRTRIDFSIIDSNLLMVHYSINGNGTIDLHEPYDIHTNEWPEGNYSLVIEAWDIAGNYNFSSFSFTIDNTAPSIWFDLSVNHTEIPTGRTIQIVVVDPDTESVSYSMDGGEYQVLEEPYILYPYVWPQGSHIISILGKDAVGNEAIRWFEVKIDTISPYITYCDPPLNSRKVDNGTNIVIAFSEPMNISNPEQYISVSPFMNFTCQWNEDGTILTISFSPDRLADGTTYTLKINKQLSDTSDNGIRSGFDLTFTTEGEPLIGKSTPSSEPSSSPYWVIIVLIVISLSLILLLYYMRGRTKESNGRE